MLKSQKNDPSINPPIYPCIGEGVSTIHKYLNRIELSRFDQDLFDFYWFDITPPIKPPVYPPIDVDVSTNYKSSNGIEIYFFNFWQFDLNPPIHPPIGGGVSTNHKSSNKIELSHIRSRFIWFLVNWHDPTHWPTHPPTYWWGCLHKS